LNSRDRPFSKIQSPHRNLSVFCSMGMDNWLLKKSFFDGFYDRRKGLKWKKMFLARFLRKNGAIRSIDFAGNLVDLLWILRWESENLRSKFSNFEVKMFKFWGQNLRIWDKNLRIWGENIKIWGEFLRISNKFFKISKSQFQSSCIIISNNSSLLMTNTLHFMTNIRA
jgi:hypothetical protein